MIATSSSIRPGTPAPHQRSTRRAGRRAGRSIGIVGAGPGGLATAALLARAGFEVTIYEARREHGGRTRRIELPSPSGTYRFDCGPTFFMMPYVLEEIMAACGHRLADHCTLTRLDPMYRLLIGREKGRPLVIDATQDVEAMVRQLAAVEPHDGPAFERFLRDNRRKLSLMEPILRRPIRGWRDLLQWDAMRVAPALRPWESLHTYLGRYFRNEHLKLALSFQSKYLGMSPFECPSLFSILPFIEYEYGIWHPQGGCASLMDGLLAVARELGATIEVGAPVERLLFEGTRCVGAVAAGRSVRHDHMVINADATWALRHLVPESLRGRWDDRRIESADYSCSTFMMYLGVEGEVDLPHHTIYTSRTYRENLADIARRGRLSPDPSVYVCNASRSDPTLAPEGDSSLYVLVPVPNRKAAIDWERQAIPLADTTLGQLESVFGIDDLRRRIRAERVVTPLDWERERITFGATFNLAHSLSQMLHRRPHHAVEGIDGLWLVGGGTHPGSGLPVIFLSAEIAAEGICAKEGVASPLRSPRPFGLADRQPAGLAAALCS